MSEPSDKEIFNQIEKKHLCEICPKMFDTQQEAYLHIREEHY